MRVPSYITGAPAKLIGSVTSAPHTVKIADLQSDHAMISAAAYDMDGARTAAIPVMVMIDGQPPK